MKQQPFASEMTKDKVMVKTLWLYLEFYCGINAHL